ncbi:MAG: hypothetical protein J7L75_03495 [Thermoproteales archaeon]|nr:hypothetical protein [Thermoproteales archaeon]
MRVYSLNVAPRPQLLIKALEKLDSLTLSGPVEVGDEVMNGVRRLCIDYVKRREASVEALIRISYAVEAGKCWSDVYLFTLSPRGSTVVVLVKRISGMGRTDPDFVIDELLRVLASEAARGCEP